jgi:hypothetical protein
MPHEYRIEYPPVPLPDYTRTAQPRPPEICCCVYFLWRGEICVYVGQTRNLRQRLPRHKKLLQGDRITWIYFKREELNRAEGFYIWLLRPRRNYRNIVKKEDEDEQRVFPLTRAQRTIQREVNKNQV